MTACRGTLVAMTLSLLVVDASAAKPARVAAEFAPLAIDGASWAITFELYAKDVETARGQTVVSVTGTRVVGAVTVVTLDTGPIELTEADGTKHTFATLAAAQEVLAPYDVPLPDHACVAALGDTLYDVACDLDAKGAKKLAKKGTPRAGVKDGKLARHPRSARVNHDVGAPCTTWNDAGSEEEGAECFAAGKGFAYWRRSRAGRHFEARVGKRVERTRVAKRDEAFVSQNLLTSAPSSGIVVNADLGGMVEYLGADFDREQVAPGDVVTIVHYWKIVEPPTDEWRMLTHVVGKSASDFVNADASRMRTEHPHAQWQAGQIIRDEQRIKIPVKWASPWAEIVVGIYKKGSTGKAGQLKAVVARLPISAP